MSELAELQLVPYRGSYGAVRAASRSSSSQSNYSQTFILRYADGRRTRPGSAWQLAAPHEQRVHRIKYLHRAETIVMSNVHTFVWLKHQPNSTCVGGNSGRSREVADGLGKKKRSCTNTDTVCAWFVNVCHSRDLHCYTIAAVFLAGVPWLLYSLVCVYRLKVGFMESHEGGGG